MCDKRTGVANEILQTEKNYVNTLRSIVSIFFLPLLQSTETDDPIIDKVEIRTIFFEIRVILGINELFLKDLQTIVEKNWHSTAQIAPLFIKYGEFFRWYHFYVCNYNNAHKAITALKAHNPRFKSFIQEKESNKELGFMDLESLLIQPVQRIAQYNLLIQDLKKTTHEEHPDYDATQKAVTVIQRVGFYVNEKKREAENIEKTLELVNSIEGFPNTAVPNRRIHLEETMDYVDMSKGESTSIQLVALSDLLFILIPEDRLYKIIDSCSYDKMSLIKNEAMKKSPILELKLKDAVYQFIAPSLDSKNAWVKGLSKILKSIEEKKKRNSDHLKYITQLKEKFGGTDTIKPLPIEKIQKESRSISKADAWDIEKKKLKKIKIAIEKKVTSIITKDGHKDIDQFLKGLNLEAHYIAPFDILNEKNSIVTRPSFIVVNSSFVTIIEKDKVIITFHMMEIESIVVNHPDFVITYQGNEILGRSEFCDNIVYQIRKTFMYTFPGIPEEHAFSLVVDGQPTSVPPPTNSKVGGFPRTYKSICEWLSVEPRNDIIWDVSNFGKSIYGNPFKLSSLEDLTVGDIKAISYTLRHNTFFTSFVCNRLNLNKEMVALLVDMLKYNRSIIHVSFKENGLTKDLSGSLLESLTSSQHNFVSIEFRNNDIEDKNIAHITKYFAERKECNLRRLNLRDAGIGHKGITNLFSQIRKNSSLYYTLTHIDLSGNKLESDGSAALASFLATPCSISHLTISNVQAKIELILEALVRGCKYIQHLDLSDNKMTKTFAGALSNFLQSSGSLKCLNISRTNISGEGFAEILTALSQNTYIPELRIEADENGFDYLCAVEISKAFYIMQNVKELSIKDNDLNDDGVSAVLTSLSKTSNGLEVLELDGNFKLKSEKARRSMIKQLCHLITSKSSTLNKLSIAGGSKGHAQLKQDILPVIAAISKSKLTEVNISGHKMGNTGAFALSRLIQDSSYLKRLHFDDNVIGFSGLKAIILSLGTNPTLEYLPLPVYDISSMSVQLENGHKKFKKLLELYHTYTIDNAVRAQIKKKKSTSSLNRDVDKHKGPSAGLETGDEVVKTSSKSSVKLSKKKSKSNKKKIDIDVDTSKKLPKSARNSSKKKRGRFASVTPKFERRQSLNTMAVLDLAIPVTEGNKEDKVNPSLDTESFENVFDNVDMDENIDIEILEDDEDDSFQKSGYVEEEEEEEDDESNMEDVDQDEEPMLSSRSLEDFLEKSQTRSNESCGAPEESVLFDDESSSVRCDEEEISDNKPKMDLTESHDLDSSDEVEDTEIDEDIVDNGEEVVEISPLSESDDEKTKIVTIQDNSRSFEDSNISVSELKDSDEEISEQNRKGELSVENMSHEEVPIVFEPIGGPSPEELEEPEFLLSETEARMVTENISELLDEILMTNDEERSADQQAFLNIEAIENMEDDTTSNKVPTNDDEVFPIPDQNYVTQEPCIDEPVEEEPRNETALEEDTLDDTASELDPKAEEKSLQEDILDSTEVYKDEPLESHEPSLTLQGDSKEESLIAFEHDPLESYESKEDSLVGTVENFKEEPHGIHESLSTFEEESKVKEETLEPTEESKDNSIEFHDSSSIVEEESTQDDPYDDIDILEDDEMD